MSNLNFTTVVHQFPYQNLTVGRLYLLVFLILKELDRIDSHLNQSSDFERLKVLFAQYEGVVKRDLALLLTDELHVKIDLQRGLLTQLREQIAYAVRYSTGAKAVQAKEVDHLSRRYFTPSLSRQGLAEIFSNSTNLTAELNNPIVAPLLQSLGLTEQTEAIFALSAELATIYHGRDDEKELRHIEGSASKLRPELTNLLERVLYALLQAVYTMTDGEPRILLDEVILSINGALDSFAIYARHKPSNSGEYIPEFPDEDGDEGGSGSGSGDDDNGNNGGDDETPPSGGGDEGSGGPLDRNIIINIKE